MYSSLCNYCYEIYKENLLNPLAIEILKALYNIDTILNLNIISLRAIYQSLIDH